VSYAKLRKLAHSSPSYFLSLGEFVISALLDPIPFDVFGNSHPQNLLPQERIWSPPLIMIRIIDCDQ